MTLADIRATLGGTIDRAAFGLDLTGRGYIDTATADAQVARWVRHGVPPKTARSMYIRFVDSPALGMTPAPPCLDCRPDLAPMYEPDIPGTLQAELRELHRALHDLQRAALLGWAKGLRRLAGVILP